MGAKSAVESVLFLRHPEGQWLVGWGQMDRMVTEPLDHPAFFLPDFFSQDPKPWWRPEHFAELSTAEILQRWPEISQVDMALTSVWNWQDPEQVHFAKEFTDLLTRIEQGELRKAVPMVMSQALRLPTAQEKFQWWARAMAAPPSWMAYGGWWGEEGLIGLTPEILFYSSDGWIKTMALAGTAPEPGPSLFSSEKDQREHQWVVDDIGQQLSFFGIVQKTDTQEWKLGRLKHLRTDLAVEAQTDFMTLVKLLHPTPALGVAPRAAGLGFLAESVFAKKRRRFGAPFGVNIPGRLALCGVAIRGLQWHEGKTWLSSGCGVVAGSQLEKEWQELKLKRAVVAEQFGVLNSRVPS